MPQSGRHPFSQTPHGAIIVLFTGVLLVAILAPFFISWFQSGISWFQSGKEQGSQTPKQAEPQQVEPPVPEKPTVPSSPTPPPQEPPKQPTPTNPEVSPEPPPKLKAEQPP